MKVITEGFGYIMAIGFFGLFAGGYVMNILSLAGSDGSMGFLMLRAVGILCPPLGAILGWV